ncbi:MAG: CocE/NonD family hydrolase [Gemmatimonadota bacterium]
MSAQRCRTVLPILVALSTVAAPGLRGQERPDSAFSRSEVMIPMRDGVSLYTQIFTPLSHQGPLPILLARTPYGSEGITAAVITRGYPGLAEDGYVVVTQDIRGRFRSEGQFVMLRQPRDPEVPGAIDESTDTYDTIEWLLANVPDNNRRVGVFGTSYGGWLTVMAMLDPHPALAAVVPQASPADMWVGDDFHHNGAFRLSYALEYAYMMESSRESTDPSAVIDRYDTYEWYLELGPLSRANERYFRGRLPSWNDFVQHPDYDAFWRRQAFEPWLSRVTVPTLNVAGWWDQEDFYGPIKIYELLERHDSLDQNFLVVGPWNHGGWNAGPGQTLGRLDFGSDTGEYFRREVRRRFLAEHLKGAEPAELPEALTFRTGTNEWVRHDAWPPVDDVERRRLFLRDGGLLSFEPPPDTEPAFDSYVSDPANPVPYRPRPIRLRRGWSTWQVEDQRFVDGRPDVLTWVSEPLSDDVTVSGSIVARLFASTSGTDSDWVVKLIDVYPEGYAEDPDMSGFQLMIAGDVFRARYRTSFERPEPVPADSALPYEIRFPANDHVFRRGHRMMVQVQSTWFPIIDRNPQRFVPNIFQARESDFAPATQRIFRSALTPSHIELPVKRARGGPG